ncbi:MAG: UbiA-like polyprenyltransferase [Planctomycetota bacterium]
MSETVQHPAPAVPNAPSGPPALARGVLNALGDIKLAHSVFALPFAVAGAFVVAAGPDGAVAWGRFAGQLALVVVCMVFARTWAMLINRLADRVFDAQNPRTSSRAVASGRSSAGQAWLAAVAAAMGFFGACALFYVFYGNAWPVLLSLPVLVWIGFYSYTKRFTALCHVFLGGALAVSPMAAGVAVGGMEGFVEHWRALAALASFVLLWVGGFDVAYALQDLDFDRERGLHSIPAAFGWRGALWIARAMHALALVALAFAPLSDARLSALAWAGVVVTGALLVYEHAVLHRRGLDGLPMAFFTVNGVVSVVLGLLLTVDTML